MAQVVSVCISEKKGTKKHPVAEISLRPHHGIVGDAHAGDWHRQVSLLANESVDRMRKEGLTLAAGDFAENILTEGITLRTLPVGTVLRAGEVRYPAGLTGYVSVMPTDGIFAVVLNEGVIRPGDQIEVESI